MRYIKNEENGNKKHKISEVETIIVDVGAIKPTPYAFQRYDIDTYVYISESNTFYIYNAEEEFTYWEDVLEDILGRQTYEILDILNNEDFEIEIKRV